MGKERYVKVETREEAKILCPWAKVIVKVNPGYKCFESTYDYHKWEQTQICKY